MNVSTKQNNYIYFYNHDKPARSGVSLWFYIIMNQDNKISLKSKIQSLKRKKKHKCVIATIFLYFIFKLRLMEIFLGTLKIF